MVPGDGVMGKELMKKVIFLDIDGVLNSNFWNADHQRESSVGYPNQVFIPKAVIEDKKVLERKCL